MRMFPPILLLPYVFEGFSLTLLIQILGIAKEGSSGGNHTIYTGGCESSYHGGCEDIQCGDY